MKIKICMYGYLAIAMAALAILFAGHAWKWQIIFSLAVFPIALIAGAIGIAHSRNRMVDLELALFAQEQASDAIFITGADARFLKVNEAACSSLGYTREELLSMSILDLSPAITTQEAWQEQLARLRQSAGFRVVSAQRTKDGRELPVELSINYQIFKGKEYLCTIARDVSKQKQMERDLAGLQQSLEMKVEQRTRELELLNVELTSQIKKRILTELDLKTSRDRLVSLTSEVNLVEERERRRIATALHDGVVQNLALAKLNLSMRRPEEKPFTVTELSSLSVLLGNAIQDLRDICFDLSPPPLYDLGLPQAIESLGERLAREHRFSFSLQDMLTPMFLPMDVRTILYQIARELLINVVKHAGATNVTVQLRHKMGMVHLSVIDDGVGFDPAVRRGFGLSNLAQRTEYLNGTMKIVSKPGRKTVVAVVVPMILSG